jgi:hypothetical protein
MRIITTSIAAFLNLRARRSTRDDPDADLMAQLPPEMLKHLLREGLYLEFSSLLLPIPIVMLADRLISPLLIQSYQPMDMSTYAWVVGALLLSRLFSWRRFGRGAAGREIAYHRKHGKWRWER